MREARGSSCSSSPLEVGAHVLLVHSIPLSRRLPARVDRYFAGDLVDEYFIHREIS